MLPVRSGRVIWLVTCLRLLRWWRLLHRRVFLEVLRWREKRSPMKRWRSSELGKRLQALDTKALRPSLRYKTVEWSRCRLLRAR